MASVDYKIKECDVLIVGGGASGIIAAIEASNQKNLKIVLASKGPVGQSGLTPTANGGTHAAIEPEKGFREMVIPGEYLNDQDLVWHLVSHTHDCVKRLGEFKIPCARLGPESFCIPGTDSLKKFRGIALQTPGIELLEDVLVTSLLTSDGAIYGATALDIASGEFFVIQARAVVLASGGYAGDLYPHSSNSPFGVSTDSTATGHVMAFLAGAELVDMEMVQFVPLPANPRCLHLRYFTEFWEGPYINRHGEVVVPNSFSFPGGNYSYLISQKLFAEMEKGNGPVYIDRRGMEARSSHKVEFKVPSQDARRKLIKSLGIDPFDNKIEIIIGSHFGMGGVRVDEKTGTAVPGLFAAGEIMGGVHGAMRIGGYSFAQIIVFGFEAGKQAANYAANRLESGPLPADKASLEKEKIYRFLQAKDKPIPVGRLRKDLQKIMEQHVFVFRDRKGLEEAAKHIVHLKEEQSRIQVPDFKRFNLDWIRAVEFSLMLLAAEVVTRSALLREESRGAHFRRDFPVRDDGKWLKHTLATLKNDNLHIDTAPVVLDRMRPEVET